MRVVRLESEKPLAFEQARELASVEADKYLHEPMNLSWLDTIADRHYPNVECCQEDGKESWEIYAESRGGEIRVEIGSDYIFIFREGSVVN